MVKKSQGVGRPGALMTRTTPGAVKHDKTSILKGIEKAERGHKHLVFASRVPNFPKTYGVMVKAFGAISAPIEEVAVEEGKERGGRSSKPGSTLTQAGCNSHFGNRTTATVLTLPNKTYYRPPGTSGGSWESSRRCEYSNDPTRNPGTPCWQAFVRTDHATNVPRFQFVTAPK
jgi:hypothetical protein